MKRSTLKKDNNSAKKSEPTAKRAKSRGPVQSDVKEVMAEVLGKLTGKLAAASVATSAPENRKGNTIGPNRDRLTVGVDLGDRWSQYYTQPVRYPTEATIIGRVTGIAQDMVDPSKYEAWAFATRDRFCDSPLGTKPTLSAPSYTPFL